MVFGRSENLLKICDQKLNLSACFRDRVFVLNTTTRVTLVWAVEGERIMAKQKAAPASGGKRVVGGGFMATVPQARFAKGQEGIVVLWPDTGVRPIFPWFHFPFASIVRLPCAGTINTAAASAAWAVP
jgi:hypothetical protein